MLRKITAVLSLIILFVSCGKDKVPPAPSGPAWTEKNSLPVNQKRAGHFSFVIDGKAYVIGGGNGKSYLADVWEYDPAGNNNKGSWTSKTSLPGGQEREGASAFALNGKGYVVGGENNGYLADVWEFDPKGNNNKGSWTSKTSLPNGKGRAYASTFVINGRGYVVGGCGLINNQTGYLADVWEFDPQGNNNKGSWTSKTSLPNGKERTGASAFALNGRGYVVGGLSKSYLFDVWEYNPAGNGSWTSKTSLPGGQGREYASTFAFNGRGYIIGGQIWSNNNNEWVYFSDVLEYNSQTDKWVQKESLPVGQGRDLASGFSINGKGYVVGGRNGMGLLDDLLEYDPTKDQ